MFTPSEKKQDSIIKKEGHFYWSQKNPNIAQQIFLENCKKGDIVLDPFLGGGSSLYGSNNLGLKFIGNDINEQPLKICQFNIANKSPEFFEDLKIKILKLKKKSAIHL